MRLRLLAYLTVWGVAFGLSVFNFLEHRFRPRLDFFVSSNGVVSPIQFETWFDAPNAVAPGDRVVTIDGRTFSRSTIEDILAQRSVGDKVKLRIDREGKSFELLSTLKRHSKQSVFTLYVIPAVLSIAFLIFAIGSLLQRGAIRVNRESAEIFSNLLFIVSLIFLTLFPGISLGADIARAVGVPFASLLLVHLFLVYPKKKGQRLVRFGVMGAAYILCGALGVWRWMKWDDPSWNWLGGMNLPILGVCFLVAMAALANTLLTSQDFWARRRARLLSLVFLVTFVGLLGAFVAFLWKGPHLSIERILALSLFFPTMFLVIFLKSDVFNLERIFKRGLHQFTLLAVSVILALLLGVVWSEWGRNSQEDWVLWVAIAVGVMLVARPMAYRLEEFFHSLIRTKVKYPNLNLLFERHTQLQGFLTSFFMACERDLAMRNVVLRFFADPVKRWTPENEQIWLFRDGAAVRVSQTVEPSSHRISLQRGDVSMGELQFDGGDEIAFDPATSKEWPEVLRTLSRCLEALSLREFVSLQQGFLAVGRMQALLAHELKNPLAIIKVCSGLLGSRLSRDPEADELLTTIDQEVTRISKALQGVFQQSHAAAERERTSLRELLNEVRVLVYSRFPDRSLIFDGHQGSERLWVWSEKENFKQALLNLIVNSFEAGSPWVEVRIQMLKGGHLQLSVRDEGGGLPKGLDVFKPFVTTKPSGTGLGLAQVRAFAERHGAVAAAENTLKGAQFTLEFPTSFVLNEGAS